MRSKRCAQVAMVSVALTLATSAALAHGWTFSPVGGGNVGATTQQAPARFTAGVNSTEPGASMGPATANPSGGVTGAKGGSTGPARSKNALSHLDKDIHIDWKLAFLPVVKKEGYDPVVLTIDEALTMSPADGGWLRENRPSLVLVTDPLSKDHQALVNKLENDVRFKTGTYFFNCFRLESADAGKAPKEARLMIYAANGALLNEIAVERKLPQAFSTLEDAFKTATGAELSGVVWKMDSALKTRAALAHAMKYAEGGIVCPDCGHERDDVLAEIARIKIRQQECELAINALRAPTTKKS